jgi:hypothetical protein
MASAAISNAGKLAFKQGMKMAPGLVGSTMLASLDSAGRSIDQTKKAVSGTYGFMVGFVNPVFPLVAFPLWPFQIMFIIFLIIIIWGFGFSFKTSVFAAYFVQAVLVTFAVKFISYHVLGIVLI